MTTHQLINQTSGNVNYWTPSAIIEAARATMGSIDLDPASCAEANARVMAGRFYSQSDDGLKLPWFGNVFCNHPFGRKTNRPWIGKLVSEYQCGNIPQACCITFACTSETWFQPLLKRPQCFLYPRTNYLLPDGTVHAGVPKGSVVTYFGIHVKNFYEHFNQLGTIHTPYKP